MIFVAHRMFGSRSVFLRAFVVVLCFGLLPLNGTAQDAAPANASVKTDVKATPAAAESLPEAVRSLMPLVVTVIQTDPKAGLPDAKPNRHAGVVIDPRGYVLTQWIAVEGETTPIEVHFANGGKFLAEVAGRDEGLGLTVLNVQSPQPIPAVSLAKIREPQLGDMVYVVPSSTTTAPLGGRITVLGVDLGPGLPKDVLQSDIKLPPSESGSLMVSDKGELIGIWCGVRTGQQSVSFAVPLKNALALIKSATATAAAPGVASNPAKDAVKPVDEKMKIFRLEKASAEECSRMLKDLFDDVKITVDALTNTIIVAATNEERLMVVEAVLLRLEDSPSRPVANVAQQPSTFKANRSPSEFLSTREFHVQRGNSKAKINRDGRELVWVKTAVDCDVAPDVKPGDVIDLFLMNIEELVVLDVDKTYEPSRSLAIGDVLVDQVRSPVAAETETGVELGILVTPAQMARVRTSSKGDGGGTKNTTHVVRLKHAKAKNIVELLTLEFTDCKFAADSDQNTIAIRRQWHGRDPLSELLRVESAIRKLDVPTSRTVGEVEKFRAVPDTDEAKQLLEKFKREDSEAVFEAARIAQLRASERAEKRPGKYQREIDERQQAVIQRLNVAFDLRLQLEELQMNELQARLKRLERQLGQRKELREKIIARRAAELIEGDALRWESLKSERSNNAQQPIAGAARTSIPGVGGPMPGSIAVKTSNTGALPPSSPKFDEIIVDLYGGSEVLGRLSKNASYSKFVQKLNGMSGVTTNFRPSGPGNTITMVIVRDPSRRFERETQQTQQKSKTRAAIETALTEAGIQHVRWELQADVQEYKSEAAKTETNEVKTSIAAGKTQIHFIAPARMNVEINGESTIRAIPFRHDFPRLDGESKRYVVGMEMGAGKPVMIIAALLDVYPASTKLTVDYLRHNSIPFAITEDDQQRVRDGDLLIKIVSLAGEGEQATPSADTINMSRQLPGSDLFGEIEKRGKILAVLQLANHFERFGVPRPNSSREQNSKNPQPTTSESKPADSGNFLDPLPAPKPGYHPDVALAWLEEATELKLEFVRLDDTKQRFKAGLRVRESQGRHDAGDLIVALNGRLFDSLDQAVAALKPATKYQTDSEQSLILKGGRAQERLMCLFNRSNTRARDMLEPGHAHEANTHFEIRIRPEPNAQLETKYMHGVIVSADGLVVIPISSKVLAADEDFPAFGKIKGIASVVASDEKHGLTLLKLNSPDQRLFHWLKCRSGLPAKFQQLSFVDAQSEGGTITAVNVPYPKPLTGLDAFELSHSRANRINLGAGAPLIAIDGNLQGIVLRSAEMPPMFGAPDETGAADDQRVLAIPAIHIEKLINSYRPLLTPETTPVLAPDQPASLADPTDAAALAWDQLGLQFGPPVDSKGQRAKSLEGLPMEQFSASDTSTDPTLPSKYRGGLPIVEVDELKSAFKNGIRKGDILVGLHIWETRSLTDLFYVLRSPDTQPKSAGTTTKLKAFVIHEGKPMHTTIEFSGVGSVKQ